MKDMVQQLVQAALDVLHHDRDEDGPETKHNRKMLSQKFSQIVARHPDQLRTALDDSQSLLAAILLESRPDSEIEAQIIENRVALQQRGNQQSGSK
jgi:hypothetical protein